MPRSHAQRSDELGPGCLGVGGYDPGLRGGPGLTAPRAQTLAALGQATSIAAAQFGHWLTPNTLEPALWTALVWLVLPRQRTGDDRLLLAAGLVAGVAAQTRFQVFALGAAPFIALVAVGTGDLLGRRATWAAAGAGAGITVLVASWRRPAVPATGAAWWR